jgi:acetyltransferase-like isoleucine patch superfamily enzyme
MDIKKEVRSFVYGTDNDILILNHDDNINVLYEWMKVRNPVRVVFNTLIIRLAKVLPLKLKNSMLRSIGMKIGKNVGIAPDVDIDPFYPELISIGDNVVLGWKVNILCHEFTAKHMRMGRVHIENNVLIGAFSSVRCGVRIGEGAIVAMDSYVNKNIPKKELWGGIPVKKIRKIGKNPP